MRELSLLVLLFASLFFPSSDSPHGKDLKISCSECHNQESWKINRNNISFNHNTTHFPLQGQHREVSCKSCHPTLVFSEANPSCMSCHTDIHEQTVGFDCERCHTTNSWIVEDITEIHQHSRFPLLGGHITADCYDCHLTASLLRFDPLGVECVDCHLDNYQATTAPNHVEANYSTDCEQCHKMDAFSWTGADFAHTIFPLTQGHAINDCARCHKDPNDYSNISSECISCHEANYNETTNPNHQQIGFSTNCIECHTTNPGWRPAEFKEHDNLFPIYSGKHGGEWNTCSDCHTNPDNYSLFTCTTSQCHEKNDTDGEHDEVGGYVYESVACLECHPDGSGEGGFNHSISAFPLTGAHINADCAACHADGYSNTPTLCSACHTDDYTNTTNPNHVNIGLSDNCDDCHTTDPGWQPASFDVHNDFFVLSGAHANNANNCAECHNGDYNNTPNTCVGCHQEDYNQTTNPPHASAQFSTDCQLCHSESVWSPSTFDHDGQYFPIYSGKHNGEWTLCSDCHTVASDYSLFSCIDCHEHNKADTDKEHDEVSDYVYNSVACLDCHPTGDENFSNSHNPFKIR